MKIKKGDNVIIVAGKDKGKTGKVLIAMPKEDKVLVEGINIKKRHQKSRTQGGKGSVVEIATPVHVSNVMVAVEGKPARVGKKLVGEKFVRINRKTGKTI
ncbi:MAG: ribosomal protein large subunit ribosomal protein [Candidatus Parcubacteria bacterium]|jgi:large subunit ribosomal protein L24